MEKEIKVGIVFATGRKQFKEVLKTFILKMREQLAATLPKICEYFNRNDFMKVAN